MISVFLSHQSSRDGVASTVRYTLDPDHRDHVGKYSISAPRWHLAESANDFAERIVESAEKMHAVRRPSGKKWDSDVSQHLAFSLPPGARLTPAERRAVEDTLIRIVAPESAACIVWHTPVSEEGLDEDGKPRCLHAHVVVASATVHGRHRLTEQRRSQGAAGEQGLLRIATADAVEQVNRLRLLEGRELLATPFEAVAAARKRRREAKGHQFRPLSQLVAEALSLNDRVDEQSVVSTLRGLGWKIQKKQASARIELIAPGGDRSFFRDLARLVDDTAAALAERVDKARAIAQRDQQQPERPASGLEVSQ